jgi:flagellar hook-length control protein FliK
MALLQAIQEISGEGTEKEASFPPLPDQVLKQTTHLLEMIRGEQILNLRLLPSRQIYIQLPFAQPSGLKMVEILILPEKDARSEKPNQKNAALTIAVSTEKLGKIKATISIINRVMTCQFKVNHRWVAELIEHHVEGLKRSLEKLDYQVAHIGCGVTSKEGELSVSADLAPFDHIGVNICA